MTNKKKLRMIKTGIMLTLLVVFWFFDFTSPIHEIITLSTLCIIWFFEKYYKESKDESITKE